MSETIPPKSGRTFSRRLVVANSVAAWAVVVASIVAGPGTAAIVVPAAFTLIVAISGAYMGIGAIDFRTAAGGGR